MSSVVIECPRVSESDLPASVKESLDVWSQEMTFPQLSAQGTLPGAALAASGARRLQRNVVGSLCMHEVCGGGVQVIETAHEVGLSTTSTIMFGHVDGPRNWARHLIAIRDLQQRTGGITEFVPLPFVHMEAPIYLKGGPQNPAKCYLERLQDFIQYAQSAQVSHN